MGAHRHRQLHPDRALLTEDAHIDGVFGADDLMALGALLALRDAGRRVPDDVAMVGFDDSSAAVAARPDGSASGEPA